MQVLETFLEGVKLIDPLVFSDTRGYFLETFNASIYNAIGITQPFVQDNFSHSGKGVLRGLHLQNPTCQGKLVTVLSGSVLDVAVDVRVGSPTFGKHYAVVLDDRLHRQLWIPRGYAHGFVALADSSRLHYKCDAPYDRGCEMSILWNDLDIGIDWGIDLPVLSEKDAGAPLLRNCLDRLPRYEQ